MKSRNVLSFFGVLLLLAFCLSPEIGLMLASDARAADEVCLVSALPASPTEVDASSGKVALCSPLFDNATPPQIWPETGKPMTCMIEIDGQVVVQSGDIGPGVVYEFSDLTMRDDHLLQSWCTSAHIEGKGDLLAPQPIPARFPPTPPLLQPGRPFAAPLP
jgi:hypothetical protein